MKCRKCGHDNAPNEWVCSRCEYILDPSFLGSDILNERTRDGSDDEPPAPLPPEEDFGGDALILGRLGASDESESAPQPFITDRSNDFMPALNSKAVASVYVTAELRNLLMPFRVLQHTADADERAHDVLGPFHLSLFLLIDGVRTLEEVQSEVGLSDDDLCVAMAMLCDKALVEAKPDPKKAPPRTVGDLDDSTRELEDLPPIATPEELAAAVEASQKVAKAQRPPSRATPPPSERAPERRAAKPASISPGMPPPFEPPERDEPARAAYDDLEMKPLPVPAPAPAAIPPLPSPRPATAQAKPAAKPASDESIRPAARASLSVRPAMPPTPRPSSAGDGKLKPLPPASTAAAAGSGRVAKAAPPDDRVARAANYFDLCMKDLHDGRQGRAWGYARMALEADPTNEKYQMLVHDWHRSQGGAHGEKASTPQELMASAQAAENSGDYTGAIEYIKKVIAIAPNSAAAHNRLAVLLATRMHEYRAAYNAAIKAVELEPGNMAYQSNMMKILARVDDDERSDSSSAKSKAGGGGGLLGRLLKR